MFDGAPGPEGLTTQVARTAEFWRVFELPRRAYSDDQVRYMIQALTALYKTPSGSMELLPEQAVSLFEIGGATPLSKGLFGGLGTGEGKTLLSLLAPLAMGAWRPMLVLPANLIAKTERDRYHYSQHWRIPVTTRIESYHKLFREKQVDLLRDWAPNPLICDEAHYLRSAKTTATRRVHRYLAANPTVRALFLSGTMTTASIRDYAHMMTWALGAKNTPLPMNFPEMDEWSLALDEREGRRQIDPGILYELCTPEEKWEGRDGARKGFRRRLSETYGVRLSMAASCNASIVFRTLAPKVPDALLQQVDTMRATWTSPNGETFDDALTADRHTRTMLTGFYGYWNPPAPRDWLVARREWATTCRAIISTNKRNLDSAQPVVSAIDAGHYPEARPILEAWRAIAPTFEPAPTPHWLNYYLVEFLRDHLARTEPSLIWCAHVPFAHMLRHVTGLPYYGRNGIDEKTGKLADDADPSCHAILSVSSNQEGRNLQQFSRNIMVSPTSNNKTMEQVISRTHRRGQEKDEVFFDFVLCHEAHHNAIARVIRQATYGENTLLGRQKILMGSWV